MWTNENRSLYDRRTLRYPSDLTYEEWALIEPPPRKPPSDPLAKSWDIAYRIFCEGNYRQTETLDKGDQRSVRLPRLVNSSVVETPPLTQCLWLQRWH
jgi:hypothetical protein